MNGVMKHITITAIITIFIGYMLGVMYPSIGQQVRAKVGF
jgi:hypothetical protein